MNRAALAAVLAVAALVPARPVVSQEWSTPGEDAGYCALRSTSRYAATTRSCLTCHDGSVGMAVHADAPSRGMGLGPSHPVDFSYDESSMRAPQRLRARAALSKRYWLPGGRMTCTTCHDGASREPKHLAAPMARSELCFGCHTI